MGRSKVAKPEASSSASGSSKGKRYMYLLVTWLLLFLSLCVRCVKTLQAKVREGTSRGTYHSRYPVANVKGGA